MGEIGIRNKVIWFAPNVIPDGFGRQELHSHNSIESSKYNLVFREYFPVKAENYAFPPKMGPVTQCNHSIWL